MANVCDYVKWRGDLELKNDEFNEIDGLILSRLSYFPFEQLTKENETNNNKAINFFIIWIFIFLIID